MNARPDFSKYEITSIASRKRRSNLFLWLCMLTSILSIVILAVLITTIVVSAMPVFGPHSDQLETQSRVVIWQGAGADNDPKIIDSGDIIQGIFQADRLVRGGLGDANNESFTAAADQPASKTLIGFYSFEVRDGIDGKTWQLAPATGQQSIARLLERMGLENALDLDQASIAVASTSGQIDFEEIEISGAMIGEPLIQSLSEADNWSVELVAGQLAAADFGEVRFSDANKGRINEIKKTRVRKKAGHLKVLASVLFEQNPAIESYENVRLRSWSTNEIFYGHLKIDEAELAGVSRRKKKGFDLGGAFTPEWCPLPEETASTAKHIAHFLSANPSGSDAAVAGIGPALWGSIWVCTVCGLFALPLGVATAVFLEEFKPANRVLLFLQKLVQLNITNLAGVPSIVYGILGLTAFATMFGLFGTSNDPAVQIGGDYYYQYLSEGLHPVLVPIKDRSKISAIDDGTWVPDLVDGMSALDGDYQPVTLTIIGPEDDLPDDEAKLKWTLRRDSQGGVVSEKPWYYFQLPLGRGVLAAALTLMLVILPVIIIASQEAIKAVPSSLREGAMGLGATRWQVVRNVTLPAAIPGIMTGAILSVSRAIGEAAPIVVLCGTVFIASSPKHLMDFYSVLPIQIFYLTGQPINAEGLVNFQNVAAAASLVLLAVLLTFNTFAIVLRQYTTKPLS